MTARLLSRHTGDAVVGNVDSKTDEVKRQILDVAARAFMKRGYAATSIDAIASHMEATKGLIYYYFKSKGDLYLDIHLQAMEVSLNAVRPIALGPESAADRLRRMVFVHVKLLMDNFAMHKVSLEGVSAHLSGSTTPEQRRTLKSLIRMRDEYEQLYVDVFRQGVTFGEFPDRDVSLFVKFLLGAVNWLTVWFKPERSRGKKSNERIANEAAEFVLNASGRVDTVMLAPTPWPAAGALQHADTNGSGRRTGGR